MGKAVSVLIVDDSQDDAWMAARSLQRGGFEVQFERVDTAQALEKALSRQPWDAVIADCRMPHFTGLEALKIVRAGGSDMPFVLVSGTVGEEIAVEAMRAGANDFVIKTNLSRLASILDRELRESASRSERKRAEQELQRFRMAMDVSPDSMYLTDPATLRFVYLNNTACQRLGYSRERLLQMSPDDVLPIGRERLSRGYDDVIAAGERGLVQESPFAQSDGTKGWAEIHSRALRTEEGTLIVTIGRNITERKRADEQIRRLNRVYAVLSGINSAIVRTSNRRELFQESCRIAVEAGRFVMAWIGVVEREASIVRPVASAGDVRDFFDTAPLAVTETKPGGHGLVGHAIRGMKSIVSNDVQSDPQRMMKKELAARGINSVAIIPLMLDGEAIGILALYASDIGFFDDEEMRLLAELAGDISFALDHIEKAERLDYISYYDPLTGAPNRALFHERLKLQLEVAARENQKLALLIVDIERFKTINDTLGRHAGDALLKEIGSRIGQVRHPTSWFARVGADHFAIVVPEVTTEEELARRTEQRLEQVFARPFTGAGTELRVSARIGVAVFPGDGADADALFRNAEAALKKAKATGERYLFYTQEMTERVAEKLSLENKLRQAIEKEEFVLHYQPKVSLNDRRIVGVEALIRWQSPELGLVPPGNFIPLLEETGLILQVGSWALRRAALDHRGWVEEGLKAPRVAVNVSQIQLRQRDFVSVVEAAVLDGIAPTGIDLEITESLVMQDVQGNIEKLKAVRGLGIKIAIDDFGTGYSSLAYLAKLPVETLKIDRAFITSMLDDPNTTTLVQTIISLAHSLQLKVIAEGVEREQQAKVLHLLGCDQMQGFLFSKPLPLPELIALLKA